MLPYDQYLENPGHFDRFMDYARNCLKNRIFSDVKLTCGDKGYYIHSFMLSLRSDYYKNLLLDYYQNNGNKDEIVILIPESSENEIKSFINSLYSIDTLNEDYSNAVVNNHEVKSHNNLDYCDEDFVPKYDIWNNSINDIQGSDDYNNNDEELEEENNDLQDEEFEYKDTKDFTIPLPIIVLNEENVKKSTEPKCIFCYKYFDTIDELMLHRISNEEVCLNLSEDNDPLKCLICDHSSETFEKLLVHEQSVHLPKVQMEKIPFEKEIFRKINKRKYTVMRGKLLRRIKKCIYCNESFIMNSDLKRHRFSVKKCCDEFIPLKKDCIKCFKCNAEFSTFKKLIEHEMNNHIHLKKKACRNRKDDLVAIGSLNCSDCDVNFKDIFAVVKHRESGECPNDRVKNGKNPLECKLCGDTCRTLLLLVYHEYNIHTRSKMCNICGIIYYGMRISHHEHFRMATNLTAASCPYCHEKFSNPKGLRTHLSVFGPNHDIENKHYECEDCDIIFNNLRDRKKHKQTNHLENKFQCDECPLTYRTIGSLSQHKNIKHGKNKQEFPCTDCDKTFQNKRSLSGHHYTYHQVGVFTCSNCPETFQYKYKLNTHSGRCLNRRFKCEFCSSAFVRFNELESHMEIVHGDRFSKNFHCEVCNIYSKSAWNLKVHLGTQLHKNNVLKAGHLLI